MLMRTDPFQDLDRVTQRLIGTLRSARLRPPTAERADARKVALPGPDLPH